MVKNMLKRKIIAVLTAVTLLAGLCSAAPAAQAAGYPLPEGEVLYAQSAILVNLAGNPEGDMVMFEKKADEVHAPGSMMRYMVLAYALHRMEEDKLDLDKVTGTYTVELFNSHVAGTGVPTANMNYGETWTLRDLMAVSFMQAASDTVAVLAVAIDGKVNTFIDGMNDLAREIGCEYSHFSNLTGLDSLGQYTTARDMYRIVRYCQQFSEFEDLAAHYQITVKPKAGGQEYTYVSNNSLLQAGSIHKLNAVVHSRTGLSEHEGRTIASVARDQGYEYLAVVMGCAEENEDGESGLHYRDTKTLFQWAFNRFEYRTILGQSEIMATLPLELAWDTDHINLVPADKVATVVDANLEQEQIIRKTTLYEQSVTAPVKKGTVLGKVELIINVDQVIGEVELVAADTVARSELLYVLDQVSVVFSSVWFWAALGALVVLILLYIAAAVIHNRRRQRNHRRIDRK